MNSQDLQNTQNVIEKILINEIEQPLKDFISVCGYGLDTLIKRSKESYDDDRTT